MLLIRRSTLWTWISGVGKEKKKKHFNSCTVQFSIPKRQQPWEAAPKRAPEADFQADFTMKGRGGGRLKSKLFHQIIAGRANVSFGKWTVNLSKAKTMQN